MDDVGRIPEYVGSSQCVMMFLSKGFFWSAPCQREIRAALQSEKPLVLVHEANLKHGGISLDTIESQCLDEWRDQIFASNHPVVSWQRQHIYQIVSIKAIASALLHASPRFKEPPLLYVRGETLRETLHFPRLVRAYASPHNPGAHEAAQELLERLNEQDGGSHTWLQEPQHFEVTKEAPSNLPNRRAQSPDIRGRLSSPWRKARRLSVVEEALKIADRTHLHASRWNGVLSSMKTSISAGAATHLCGTNVRSHHQWVASPLSATVSLACHVPPRGCTVDARLHSFLYLNERTFEGEAGQALADELRRVLINRSRSVRSSKRSSMTGATSERSHVPMKVILVHENDPGKGACEFDRLFRVTPEDLVRYNLYGPVAIPFLTGEHRAVSHLEAAKAMGALVSRRSDRAVNALARLRLEASKNMGAFVRLRVHRGSPIKPSGASRKLRIKSATAPQLPPTSSHCLVAASCTGASTDAAGEECEGRQSAIRWLARSERQALESDSVSKDSGSDQRGQQDHLDTGDHNSPPVRTLMIEAPRASSMDANDIPHALSDEESFDEDRVAAAVLGTEAFQGA